MDVKLLRLKPDGIWALHGESLEDPTATIKAGSILNTIHEQTLRILVIVVSNRIEKP